MGDGCTHESGAGWPGFVHGGEGTQARAGVERPFGSQQPICQCGLSANTEPVWHGAVDESQGELLGARSLALGHNAPMESWFASLKKEEVHLTKYATRAAARTAIFDYVEVFYAPKEVPLGDNNVRRHSKINNQSPIDFEKNWYEQQLKKAA